ncbi:MAG: hypothetical protein OEV14_01055 [Gammaproteobacteria bacterium]|nr:hypothetical protein [Gammaproteobacteria bacterium]
MKFLSAAIVVLLGLSAAAGPALAGSKPRTVGVLFVVHGGSDDQDVADTFDTTLQFFQYDPNNIVFKGLIWNASAWPNVIRMGDSQSYANAATQLKKYAFAVERMGGKDPAPVLTDRQFASLQKALKAQARRLNVRFVADIAQWIGSQEQASRLPWPRYLYEPQVPRGTRLTYCGSATDGGPWAGCDPQRYNVDGPAERLLKQGAGEIVMVDMTVGGMRFWKTYDVVSMTRRVVADWNRKNGTAIPVRWVNDPTDLMQASYPADPPNWTRSLGPPKADSRVPLAGRDNPVIEDPLLTAMHADGIEAAFNRSVKPADTAVLFVNHATRDGNETYDPKIDDTLVLDGLIKQELLRRHPKMRPENILGSWMGVREPNPAIRLGGRVRNNLERTREMRGEDLGGAWLYESKRQMPGGDHRYRYWEALDLLRQRGVGHIVVIFSQIVIDNAFNLIDVPNQIAKEIGARSWLYARRLDRRHYPAVGHPFADYWGVWADTQCRSDDSAGPVAATGPCCLKMGGCGDARPYPPPRQTPIDQPRPDTDPSLVFDIPAWGHLGYDPAAGPPSAEAPVQGQYRGTWALWRPPNDDPRMGKLLAHQVAEFLRR